MQLLGDHSDLINFMYHNNLLLIKMKSSIKLSTLILSLFLVYSCKEKSIPPVLSTTSATEITSKTAVLGGVITDDGGAAIILKGVCWNTSENPTIDNLKTIESGESLSFVSNLLQLTPATLYYARAYATNSSGISYGNSVSFTTHGDKPVSATLDASNIQIKSATLNGSVNPNYLSTTISFEWGTSTSYGNTTTPSQSPASGNSSVNISADLTGLTPGTTYHFRVKATNELGTINSNDLTFETLGQVPFASTQVPNLIKINSTTLQGSVNPNYLSTTVSFEWGATTSYGNTITSLQSPLTGSTTVNVIADLSSLSPETTYHYRIKVTNELGTTFGNDQTFTTYALMDADNNFYHSVTIGTQTWMKANLKSTKYRNGDLIETTDPATKAITGENEPKYQWVYNGNDNNLSVYGRLYTGYVATDSRNICPDGWHVPSKTEWMTLVDYNGGMAVAGLKLKEAGTSHYYPNMDATNESGFTALPGGSRIYDGTFWGSGHAGVFWTIAPIISVNSCYTVVIYGDRANIDYSLQGFYNGESIRCIKD
jgi:uncharacterized protein (TIGR02145 family)